MVEGLSLKLRWWRRRRDCSLLAREYGGRLVGEGEGRWMCSSLSGGGIVKEDEAGDVENGEAVSRGCPMCVIDDG